MSQSSLESPEAARSHDVETDSGTCRLHAGDTAVCEESDIAVAVEDRSDGCAPLTVASSLADLFEQVTKDPGAKRTEPTIFDRIGQMTLF